VVNALAVHGLAHEYAGQGRVLSDVAFTLAPGELACLVGPNGSGKSTLLRLCAGLDAPTAGSVEIEGTPVRALTPRARARRIAFVSQALRALPDAEVTGFVLGGRYAHHARLAGVLARETRADREAVERALAEADALDLAGRRLDELSLGQFQRVRVARALAQEAPLLLLDEPTAALDPEHQVRLFLLIERLVEAGRTALVVTHELNLASRFARRCLVLSAGRVAADGLPEKVFTPAVLAPVFGPHLHYGLHPGGTRPLVVPWPSEGA